MKLAIAYSTKDQANLTEQTVASLVRNGQFVERYDIWWADGSVTAEGKTMFSKIFYPNDLAGFDGPGVRIHPVYGGADAAIAWKLSKLLASPEDYTHIGLLENDVLLDEDWFEPTMELFKKGKADGLSVGAVSPRSYVDRVLIQREGYGVMHNIGAGVVIFTREAAEIVLRSFRTHWWPTNRYLFAQVSGIDLATYAAFAGRDQWVTTDWGWEAQLAAHGLASLALTPAKCQMIGQNPSLDQQGLALTGTSLGFHEPVGNGDKFETYRNNLAALRRQEIKTDLPGVIHRDGAGMLFFAHQLGYLAGGPQWQGTLELQWNQGFGPFAYRAGPGGASLSLRLSGTSQFLVTGGVAGARVAIRDTRSGFNFAPDLPPDSGTVSLNVPGGPVPRWIELELSEGAVFYGLQTADPQLLDTTFRFDWSQLPRAK